MAVTNDKHIPGRRGGLNSAATSRRLAIRGNGQCDLARLVLTSDLERKHDDQHNQHEGQQHADDDECHPHALVVYKQEHVQRTHIHQQASRATLIWNQITHNGVALKCFRSVNTFRLTFMRMRNKCKIINVQRNNKAFSL